MLRSPRAHALAGTALAGMVLLASPARAQTAPATPAAETVQPADAPGDIVVTARRTEERLQDVPISITVFNQQQLSNRNIVNAADIAQYTPSLQVNSRFGPDKTSFSIRGFNQDVGTAPSVGVYFAEAPSLRAFAATASGNGAGPGAFFDLQNTQILKGPQGTLFGRNTSGGAILLVPQRPTSRLEGYVEGTLGTYDLHRIQAVLNAPVGDHVRVRLGVDHEDRGGFMRNVSGIGPKDFNNIDYVAVRGSAVIDVTPNLENYFVGTWSRSTPNGFLPRIFACNRGQAATSALIGLECAQVDRAAARGFYTGENSIIAPYLRIEQFQLVNNTKWAIGDSITLKNIVSYGEYRERVRGTVYGENLVITTGPDAGRNAFRVIQAPYPGRNIGAQSTLSEEVQLQGRSLGDTLTWQVGAYVERSDPLGLAGAVSANTASCTNADALDNCRGFVPGAGAPPAATTLVTRSNKYYLRDYAGYAQATYALSPKLSATAGFRYTYDTYRVTTRQINYVPAPVVASPAPGYCVDATRFGVRGSATNPGTLTEPQCEARYGSHSQAPTFLVDLDYKPVEAVLAYAKFARGYRQGLVKSEGYGREAFQPEKIDDYEIGVKASWRGAVSGTFNIAGFYNDFTNQQVAATGVLRLAGATPSQLIVNAGKSRIKGIEIDASISPVRAVSIDFGYAYLDTDVRALTLPQPDAAFAAFTPGGALVGYPLTYSPKNKYTITGTYALPLPPRLGRLSVAATFTHADQQYANFQDTALARAGAIPYDYGLLPATNLLNLNLNWTSVGGYPIDLSVFATNVTARRYYVATFGGYPTFGFEAGAVGEPRMVGARLKYRFGR